MKKEVSHARRHFMIPDCQLREGVPTDHIAWIAQAIVDYMPDEIVNIGDWADMHSLSRYAEKGSKEMEGARYRNDVDVANRCMEVLNAPMEAEIARRLRNKKQAWRPGRHYTLGNHENRIDRALNADPKLEGIISTDDVESPGWTRYPFLERVTLDGIVYSHYFQSAMSSYAIGGSIDNRLNKIGESFCQGHQQGFLYGTRVYPTGKTRHGLVAGSCYLHREEYRGNQGNTHWRGVVVLNEVHNGNYCLMPLTLNYLCRRYEGVDLLTYMNKKYPGSNWDYLVEQ